jgi:hypothetical protein
MLARHQTQTTNTIPTQTNHTTLLSGSGSHIIGDPWILSLFLFYDNLKNWLLFLQQKYTIFLP